MKENKQIISDPKKIGKSYLILLLYYSILADDFWLNINIK